MGEEKKESRRRAEGTISVGVSAFPLELWKQWKADCEKNYGDCHWIKIWSDHQMARNHELFEALLDRLKDLEIKVSQLEGDKGKDVNVVKTFKKDLKSVTR